MGFFGKSTASSVSNVNIEDLLKEENLPMYDGMSIMEACYAGIAETEMNWNAIMEAAAETEMNYFMEHGEEYVYTEASGFGAKVAEFFKKIWEKIKGLFKKFAVMMGSLVGKDKDFVKKYAETIRRNMKNIPSDASIKGFPFKDIKSAPSQADMAAVVTGILDGGQDATFGIGKDDYDVTEANEKMRGVLFNKVCGGSASTMTDSEFRKELVDHIKGESDDIAITTAAVNEALGHLEGSKDVRKTANDLYKNTEKLFKDAIKSAEKAESDGYKKKDSDVNELKKMNQRINLAKAGASAVQVLCAVYLQSVKDFYAQQRKICVKVVTYKNVKEGATIEHVAEGAFAKVSLI